VRACPLAHELQKSRLTRPPAGPVHEDECSRGLERDLVSYPSNLVRSREPSHHELGPVDPWPWQSAPSSQPLVEVVRPAEAWSCHRLRVIKQQVGGFAPPGQRGLSFALERALPRAILG